MTPPPSGSRVSPHTPPLPPSGAYQPVPQQVHTPAPYPSVYAPVPPRKSSSGPLALAVFGFFVALAVVAVLVIALLR